MYESTIHSKYKGNFVISLYDEEKTKPSTWENAYFVFEFNRNNVIIDGSKDVYTITIPKGCSIVSNLSTVSEHGSLNVLKSTITYENYPYSKEEQNMNSIVMRCPIDNIKSGNKISVSVNVKETIEDKEPFTYMDGTFEQSLVEYYENHPLPSQRVEWKQTTNEQYLILPIKDTITDWSTYLPTDKAPLTSWNFLISSTNPSYAWFRQNDGKETTLSSPYTVFNTVWLQNILTINSAYAEEIIAYVSQSYPNLASITDTSIEVPGFKKYKYQQTTEGEVWKYEIEENFVGYARTNAVDFTENNYMYFSTTDSNTLNEAFKMYLDTYPYQGVDKTELKNLVDQYENGVSDILKLIDANGDIYIDGKLVFRYDASENLLELVKEAEEPDTIIHIPFNDEATMKATFESELKRIYSDLSESTITKINADNDILTSILKNSTLNSNKESYSEYFIVQDGNNYVLVNVYSDGIEYTCVTVSNLDANLENDTLSFGFSGKNKADLLSIVNALDEHLLGKKIHSSLPDDYDSYLVVTTSGDVTNVVYTIPNKSGSASFDRQTTTEKEMADAFIKSLTEVYDGIVAKETIEYVLSFETINKLDAHINPGLYMLRPVSRLDDGSFAMKNLTPYNYYFVVAGQGKMDKDKYWLFNVYTNGYDNVYTTITELAPKGGNGTIVFELQNDNLSVLRQVVRALDYYFTGGYLHDELSSSTITVSYPITSTASIQDLIAVEEVSASLQSTKVEQEYLEVVSDENTIDEKLNSITAEDKDENKKNSNTQDTETNNTTEETEETSSDDSYVPSSNASNVDTVPSSDGGTTNTTSSITDEVIGVNSSPTSGVSLVEAG